MESGWAQALALIPGVSPGSTLTAGLFAGLEREQQLPVFVLLGIPAITAGLVALDALEQGLGSPQLVQLMVGVISAAVFPTRRLVAALPTNQNTWVFVWYPWLLSNVGAIQLGCWTIVK